MTNTNDNNNEAVDFSIRIGVATPSVASTRKVVVSMLGWIGFGFFGWHFPRHVQHQMTYIAELPSPYQLAGSDESLILDFDLLQPLVEPHDQWVDYPLLHASCLVLPLVYVMVNAWCFPFRSTTANAGALLRHRIYCAATAIAAFSHAIGLEELTVYLVKLWVKRRRPNYYALCGFDPETKLCQSSSHHDKMQANLSFPSGHSSLAMVAMTFLVLYLRGSLAKNAKPCYTEGRRISVWLKTCLPLGWAIFVGASRVADHWHHPADVMAGMAVGAAAAFVGYGLWYPPTSSAYRGIPLSLLRIKQDAAGDDSGDDDAESGLPSQDTPLLAVSTKSHAATKRRPPQQQQQQL